MLQQAIAIIRPKKPLASAGADALFWLHKGSAVKDLKELKDVLKKASRDQFAHHVNAKKNDFARWIEDVLHDRDLALKLNRCKTRLSTVRTIETHLQKNYSV